MGDDAGVSTGDWRPAAYDRYRHAVDLPLLVLAVALVPLLVLPVVIDLSSATERALVGLDWLIWAVFAADYLIGLALAPSRRTYLRREWPNLVLVLLPMLRPLRVLRSTRALRTLRLARAVSALSEGAQQTRRLLVRHNLHYALLATLVLTVGGGLAIDAVESGGRGPIHDLPDALWWAISTTTTAGSSDAYPVTSIGRGIGVVLMLGGLAFIGVLTANLATFLLERSAIADPPVESHEVLARLAEIAARLDALDARLDRDGA